MDGTDYYPSQYNYNSSLDGINSFSTISSFPSPSYNLQHDLKTERSTTGWNSHETPCVPYVHSTSLVIEAHKQKHYTEKVQGIPSMEETLPPPQLKRKAQNRAVQRAFRERKERHLRELESKVSDLETALETFRTENSHLQLYLQHKNAENEELQASVTSTSSHSESASETYALRDDVEKLEFFEVWDILQGHSAVKQGLIDIVNVLQKLGDSS